MSDRTEIIHTNADSIEIGTPSKGGAVKVYGDFTKPDEFRAKIDAAMELRRYAEQQYQASLNGEKP